MIQVSQISSQLQDLRTYGVRGILSTGSWQLDNHVKLKKGYPWFIGGQPHSGKTEVAMELLLKWSKLYGWKHYCYFGEGGDVHEIVADLCAKFTGKSFVIGGHNSMSESERTYAEQFISEHFYFADPDKDFSYESFIQNVEVAERELGMKFDTTLIDPFNDLDYDLTKYPNITYWLKDVLKAVRVNSKKNKRVDIIVVHVADVPAVKHPETGMMYHPPALPSQWEGGKIWWRRAFVMVLVYKNYNGHTELYIQKAKPKSVKMYPDDRQLICTWEWQWKENRYYENAGGERLAILADKMKSYKPTVTQPEEEPPF